MSISQKAIGQRLRTAREKQGISRKDVAQAVGISNVLLSRIETGKSTITIELLVKLCVYLMVSETEILLGIDVPSDIGVDSRFRETASSCSDDTVETMLEVCRIIAKIEETACKGL